VAVVAVVEEQQQEQQLLVVETLWLQELAQMEQQTLAAVEGQELLLVETAVQA